MASSGVKRVNLALQGGGAHGAFTWGVLDRLLEDESIEIAGISGTSAGALNGAAVKAGLVHGDRDTARKNLDWLWQKMGAVSDDRLSPWLRLISPSAIAEAIERSVPFAMADAASRIVSPYSYGPLYKNPLTSIVEEFQYEHVCGQGGPAFHVCATNVRTGKIRVFTGHEIGVEPLLASACLPTLFQAVEILDPKTGITEAYWDGGYTGNPALFPLFSRDLPADLIVVNINPLYRAEIPKTPSDINNRINEISFNSSLLRELRAIEFVQRLLSEGRIVPDAMKRVLVHMIADDKLMQKLSVATKSFPTPHVLHQLKMAGREACDEFLETSVHKIGHESTVDLMKMFN
ncbi:MAG: NTE family protein [Paracoccaceae bacterium]|jgi:NTE family protein